MSNIEHIFVINLKHRTDRWISIQDNFKHTNLELIRWNAVYGKQLMEKEIKKITSQFCNTFCSYGMIGCWLSHYRLWHYIVKNKLNNVLILEDDARPITDFNDKLSKLLQKVPNDYDLVYFGCFGSCDEIGNKITNLIFNKKNKEVIINNKKVKDLMIPALPLGTHAYLISYNGANKLIHHKELKKVRYHVDFSLSNYVYDDDTFMVYAFKEPLIMQSSDVNSSDLLTNDHPILNFIFSKIKISNNYNLDYIMSCQALNIRDLDVNITVFMILFGLIAFIVGLSFGEDATRKFIVIITCLYIAELLMQKKPNIKNAIAEIFVIMTFFYLGSKLKNKSI